MTPYKRVLILVGGAALVASLALAAILVWMNAADAGLRADEDVAGKMQVLGDRLLTEVNDQHDALYGYLLSADPGSLDRYRQAVTDEAATASEIRASATSFSAVTAALSTVDSVNDAWRTSVGAPAIAAVQSGSMVAIKAATDTALQDVSPTQAATSELVRTIDGAQSALGVRSDALDGLRVAATAFGVAVELLAAAISLWFVRRYALTVSRDSQRRLRLNAEHIEIVASLRTLRTKSTPEATAAVIAEALHQLPGVDVAGVLACTADGLVALAIAGLPGFPIQTGQAVPAIRAGYLRERSAAGPWGERWVRPAEPGAYEERLTELGIKGQAYAPIRADGQLIGLIAMATTDEGHGDHLVEDLPAVVEFASVAETLLAPALVRSRDRAEQRRRFAALIASAAFAPVFQPIMDLSTGATVGFEALTRFDDGSRPDVVFTAALECGMGMELETVTLEAALRDAHNLASGPWLSLNVSPALLAHPGPLASLLMATSRAVVLEVTEHEAVEAYAPLREAMLALGHGVRLAVDDVGAGVANFNHLVELRPEFIKIDVGLVRGVDRDPSRRAVVVGLVHFAAEARCQVIAEGIETEAERTTVMELGVTLGQGYLLAKPAPIETPHAPRPSGPQDGSRAHVAQRRRSAVPSTRRS